MPRLLHPIRCEMEAQRVGAAFNGFELCQLGKPDRPIRVACRLGKGRNNRWTVRRANDEESPHLVAVLRLGAQVLAVHIGGRVPWEWPNADWVSFRDGRALPGSGPTPKGHLIARLGTGNQWGHYVISI
jgi:hypothetical protein